MNSFSLEERLDLAYGIYVLEFNNKLNQQVVFSTLYMQFSKLDVWDSQSRKRPTHCGQGVKKFVAICISNRYH